MNTPTNTTTNTPTQIPPHSSIPPTIDEQSTLSNGEFVLRNPIYDRDLCSLTIIHAKDDLIRTLRSDLSKMFQPNVVGHALHPWCMTERLNNFFRDYDALSKSFMSSQPRFTEEHPLITLSDYSDRFVIKGQGQQTQVSASLFVSDLVQKFVQYSKQRRGSLTNMIITAEEEHQLEKDFVHVCKTVFKVDIMTPVDGITGVVNAVARFIPRIPDGLFQTQLHRAFSYIIFYRLREPMETVLTMQMCFQAAIAWNNYVRNFKKWRKVLMPIVGLEKDYCARFGISIHYRKTIFTTLAPVPLRPFHDFMTPPFHMQPQQATILQVLQTQQVETPSTYTPTGENATNVSGGN